MGLRKRSPPPDTSKRKSLSVPLTPSYVMRAVREMEDWWGERGLGRCLFIPQSKLKEIRQTFSDEMDQKKQAVLYWINTDPEASWRRLIWVLDLIQETKLADSIRFNAEPLTDPSLTPIKLFHAVSTVKHFWKGGLLEWLGVPLSVQDRIRASPSYYSEDERRTAGLQYYLQTVPGASWGRIASVLWFMEEHTSLETVTQYLLHKHVPSLTLANMMSALDSLPDTEWQQFGLVVHMPLSKLDKIRSQFQNDGERKEEVFRVYLTEHPCPTWEQVSEALYNLGDDNEQCHSVLDRLQSMFPTGRRRAKQIYEEEMKRGVTKRVITKVVMVGVAGSGKSTSLETVMEEKPLAEEDRESTPLLKRPVQTEVIYIEKNVKWVKKTPEEKKRYIANLLRARAQRLGQSSATANDVVSSSTQPPATPTPVQSTPDQPEASTHQSPTATRPTKTSATPTSAATTATAERSSSTAQEATIESLLQSSEVDEEFISLINIPSDSLETILTERCVYIVDSGGQPEFVDAMTVFLGQTSACILVIDLSQPLDHHPLIGYYRRGKSVSKPYRSNRTNEEHLKQCMQTMSTFISKWKGPLLKILFLGTHRDKLQECDTETVEEKNKRLKKLIPTKFAEQVIWFNSEKLIFEMNALNPDDTDKKTAERVRCYIIEQCPTIEVEIPMRWHTFDEKLRSFAVSLGRMVMSRQECWQVAESLGLDKVSFNGALDFFHSVSLMFYFRDILPEIVFIDPQVMLDKVSELIEFMFELREPEDQDKPPPDTPAAADTPSDAGKQSSEPPKSRSDACKQSQEWHEPSSDAAASPSKKLSIMGRFLRNPFSKKQSPVKSPVKMLSSAVKADTPSAGKPSSDTLKSPSNAQNHPNHNALLQSAPKQHSSEQPSSAVTSDPGTLPPGWLKFKLFGRITKEFLQDKRFSSHYHAGIFTSDDLVLLLEELLVFANQTTDDGPDTWFMPSVLRQVPADEMVKVCVSTGALVADFPDGGPQNGICCSLMSHVLSHKNQDPCPWKLCLSSNEPACLYRDCIQFQVPEYLGSVTLMDRYDYFEVHVLTSEEEEQELWQHVRKALFSGIETVCETLGYSSNKPRPAIICPAAHISTEKPHSAYVKNEKWACTKYLNVFGYFKDMDAEFTWRKETGKPVLMTTNCPSSTAIHSKQCPPSTSQPVMSTTSLPVTSSVTTFPTLGVDDLFTISSELLPVADKWKRIGLALRLDPDLLRRIRRNNTDVEDCLVDVLTQWLKKAYNTQLFGNPSWKLLVEAVAHPAGGNDCALAETIARKYNAPPPLSPRS